MDNATATSGKMTNQDLSTLVLTSLGQRCLRSLMRIWFDFERKLGNVPVVRRIEQDRLSIHDYQLLLLNMRQQVIEGARWISRCASSFDRDYADVRSEVISHAYDEHRDYEMLESDYLNTGANIDDIRSATRNIGSEALHGFMMYRASQPNPIDMIGAMWIIEGLGNKMATQWSKHIKALYANQSDANVTSFMDYHGENDAEHMAELYRLIDRVCTNEDQLSDIERTATVVARLYIMQLEDIDRESKK